MTQGIKSIHKRGAMNQKGYARLYGVLSLMAITVVSVLIYQSVVYREQPIRTDVVVKNYTRVQIFPNKLPDLSRGAYELWVMTEGDYLSLGKFQVDDSGMVSTASGVLEDNIFTLPKGGTGVSGAKITLSESLSPRVGENIDFLVGERDGDRANLVFSQDFASASGKYMLATPTDNNTLVNERSGLWFGEVLRSKSALSLPQLPRGWVYEGWAVIDDSTTLTTGSFIDTASSDTFSGFSDTQGIAPQFPGEDFLKDPPVAVFPGLTFPVDLVNQRVEVTIEPRDSDDKDPTGAGKFPFAVLVADVPRRAEANQLFDLTIAEDLPTALVVFR